jgi:anaerobic magnesium-protoporphyrin IX monomethyl ester cyclase
MEEVDQLIDLYNMREVAFIDDVLTVNKERTYQLCEKLAQRKDKLIWSCNVKVGLVDKKILKTMRGSGCWMVMVGIESGSQKIVDTIKKNFKLEQAQDLCNWCREVGLMVHPNFIIGHPGETEDTINQTIDFARRLYSHYPLFTLMVPYPGTELWNNAEKYGKLKVDNFDYFTLGNEDPCFVPYGLSEELLLKKRREAYRKCYLNFSMVMRHLPFLRSFEDIKRLFCAMRILAGL